MPRDSHRQRALHAIERVVDERGEFAELRAIVSDVNEFDDEVDEYVTGECDRLLSS